MGADLRVGHWSDPRARTGCTVVLLPEGTVVSGEVRGSAPATREVALLAPERTVDTAHALVLSGGSAFGLATADGVMRWLAGRGVGFDTPAGPVPIVVALALFDLAIGDATVQPGATEGALACDDALVHPGLWEASLERHIGRVGVGTGATVGKWNDVADQQDAGLGAATQRHDDLVVTALVGVNAVGYVGERRELGVPFWAAERAEGRTNTTIGVVCTNARLDKPGCFAVAHSGHAGLARAIDPVHTGMDGDALLVAATGEVDAPLDLVRALGARAVEDAVRSVPLP